MSGVDALPNQVETRSRLFNHPFGKTSFRSELMSQDCYRLNMQLGSSSNENNPEQRSRSQAVGSTLLRSQSKANQGLTVNDPVYNSRGFRAFGLQSRISSTIPPSNPENNLRLNHVADNLPSRNNMPLVSKTFGLVSEDLNSLSLQDNERLNQELRRENNVNSFIMPRSLGLQTKNIPPHSHLISQDDFAVKQNINIMNCRRSNINTSAVSGTSGLNSENLGSLNFHDNGGFNQNSKRNSSYLFGLSSKNLTLHTGVVPEGNLRLNQYSNQKNNMSTVSKIFGPAVRNTSLTTGFQMQDSMKYNDNVIDNGGFRRPIMPKAIRGRNSTLSSRLFHYQNTRHCQDLSNINGFNVSHISRREMDTLSESRPAINMRSNCVDNQSISESVFSVTSMKSQFLNLLENLHHSILNIGPHITAEAVRMEFDRAKQRLDNISEMSFAPSVNEVGPISVINQSSKHICPPISESIVSNTINESSLHLKSSKDLLKMIMQGKKNFKNKSNESTHAGEQKRRNPPVIISSQNKEFNDEQDSDSLFKKPKPYIKRRKISQMIKIKTPQMVKSVASKVTNKMINLKQWYPIAFGSNLAFCGVDEQGETVRTDAVKKRLNRRKVELISGLGCNLIGNPSAMVSLLPPKIMALLKNGLTDRWRVLQKELLNCQTAEEENKLRKSQSPRVKSSPEKKTEKTLEGKAKKAKLESPKVISTPKKRDREIHTRSGRTVKPPSMFWLLPGSGEVTSPLVRHASETTPIEVLSKKKIQTRKEEIPAKKSKKTATPNKKQKKANEESPNKSTKTSSDTGARKSKKGNESPSRKAKSPGNVSPGIKKRGDESPKKLKKKQLKVKSPKNSQKKENEDEIKVHSSTEDGKQQIKARQAQGKRKRKVTADSDSNQAKKSKLEKKAEIEVESTVGTPEPTKKGKKRTKKLALSIYSPKIKEIKSPSVKKKKEAIRKKAVSKKVPESKKETKELTELEDDFELKLNDIEIPEIANVSGNLHLSRSQLRLVSMETPPLKYFSNNLKLLGSATPVRSPDWCISQRTESEVKQFQKRREEAFKKKVRVGLKKTVIMEKSKNIQNKDVKRMMEWVAEKTVRSPQWNSKLLRYVIPSRRRMEQQDSEEEDEDVETEFL